jgi:hypothetical protein
MYITKINNLLDETIDKFMYSLFLDKKTEMYDFKKILKEPNFTKLQKEINNNLNIGENLISDKKIAEIATKNSNVQLIKDTINKYMAYYLFILIGINYDGTMIQYNNNIVEYNKNQNKFGMLDNFYNTESNSNIIKIVNIINEFKKYIKNNKIKISPELDEFIQEYGKENINKLIKSVSSKNEIVNNHNLVKMMIYLKLYKTSDKNELYKIIETTETSNEEFIFIEIIVPQNELIDVASIETILSIEQVKKNMAVEIHDILNINEINKIKDAKKFILDYNHKIQQLFDNKIIIPIVDDFLLYHKTTEKYENKTENTKIKYIVNKIHEISTYYKNPNEIKKLFYSQMINKNAVLTNIFENYKIYANNSTLMLSDENANIFSDFISYTENMYIPFKYNEKNGIQIINEGKTITVVRKCSLNNSSGTLLTHAISKNSIINVVGFLIVNDDINKISLTSLNDISYSKNIMDKINEKINLKIQSKLDKNYMVLFDLEKNIYSVSYQNKFDKNDMIKIIFSDIYNEYLYNLLLHIKSYVLNNNNLEENKKYFDDYLLKYPDLLKISFNEMDEINDIIYNKKITYDKQDEEEEIFYGLHKNVIKLPTYDKSLHSNIPIIKINSNIKQHELHKERKEIKQIELFYEDEDNLNNISINTTCQHIISWYAITHNTNMNKTNINKTNNTNNVNNVSYAEQIYAFIQKYALLNDDKEFVCKSCKNNIDELKNYVKDGKYDNTLQRYIGFSVPVIENIENMPEYANYLTVINNLEKIIDKISSISTVYELMGITFSAKSKRKILLKNIIDFILIHTKYLKDDYMTIKSKQQELTKINSNYTNLFYFDLKNDIFTFSSNEVDKMKMPKYNNIITYILLFIILDLDETQILSLNNDKLCNYASFKNKGLKYLFSDIKIIININNELEQINNYPVLCYVIYIFSCLVSKYNLWIDENKNKDKFVNVQKQVIHTFVELLNSILIMNDDKKQKKYLYEILTVRYYIKINFYKDNNFIKRLDDKFINNTKITGNKITITTDKFDIKPNKEIENPTQIDNSYNLIVKKYTFPRLKFLNNYDLFDVKCVSNLTNCIDGHFHNYKTKDINLVCVKCNVIDDVKTYIKNSDVVINKKITDNVYIKLAKKYCLSGKMHNFKNKICVNCNYLEGSTILYSNDELVKMKNNIDKIITANSLYVEEKIKNLELKNKEKINVVKKVFDKIMYKFQKYDNKIINSLNVFIDNIQQLIGSDIIINNNTYNITENIYIINHNFNGNKSNEIIKHYENEKKFKIVLNHPYFKRDVIVYLMNKQTKYELFYDKSSKYLLGYREHEKKIIEINNMAKLIINYSIKNMLLMFGLTSDYTNIYDVLPNFYGLTEYQINNIKKKQKKTLMNLIINKIINKRYNTIKNLGYELNKYITRIKYDFKVKLKYKAKDKKDINSEMIIDENNNNKFDIIYHNFYNKIGNKLITFKTDKNKTHEFLKYINTIIEYLPIENFKDELEIENTIDYNTIINNDFTGNLTLNYIIDEINRLIEYNTVKSIQVNVITMILEFMYSIFNSTNIDVNKYGYELTNQKQSEYSSLYFSEFQNALEDENINFDNPNINEMTEEEVEKYNDEKDDLEEEQDALDIEEEIDIESDF